MATPVAVFYQEGFRIDYTPVADVPAGGVVDLGTFVGIASELIPAGTLGSLGIEGVFDIAKAPADVFAVGDAAYLAAGGLTATKVSAGSLAVIGKCVKPAAAADATVRVKLLPSLGGP